MNTLRYINTGILLILLSPIWVPLTLVGTIVEAIEQRLRNLKKL